MLEWQHLAQEAFTTEIKDVSACSDVGSSVKFRWSDGTEISNTASITRGYKAGLNYIQTAGAKET